MTRQSGVAIALPAIGLAVGTGLAIPQLLALAHNFGRYVPTPDPSTDFAKGALWAAVLMGLIFVLPLSGAERRGLAAAWLLKCFVTLGFMLLYEANYEALDAYEYFASAQSIALDSTLFKLGGGTELMYAISAVHTRWIVPTSFHALKVTCSFVGLVALYTFYRAASIALGTRRITLLYALVLVPSVLFWSSIIGKDPFVLLGIALFTYGIVGWLTTRELRFTAWAVVGLILAAMIRLWLAPILAGSVLIASVSSIRGTVKRFSVLVAGVSVLGGLLFVLGGYFAIETFSDVTAATGSVSQRWAEGGSAQSLSMDLSDPVQLLKFLPIGVVTALLRPLPGEVNNAFGLLAGLENLILIGLLGLAVARTRLRELGQPVVLWALSFVLLWALIYGPISYQNLGTGVRFRLQVLPVFVLLLLYLARRRAPDETAEIVA